MITMPDKHRILIVDDEPDVAAVTRLSLRDLNYRGRSVEFATASTGREAVEAMRARPDTSVILLDVVMETATAGLDACRAIREELGNRFVRILLRTGQPGVAPERKTIDEYDIDDYLPKAELTTNRLYVSIRTALKAFEELVELERHRQTLTLIHDSVASLRSFEPLEV
ncbi:MAG: response regulator, partial [Candidatus Tectomicrobia bacterium]|nr:response regulator [Candidatus Tectomicrobia bacterium]